MRWEYLKRYSNFSLVKNQFIKLSLIVIVLTLIFSYQAFSENLSQNDLVKENISLQSQVINLTADSDAKDIIIKDKDEHIDKLENKLGGDRFIDFISNISWCVIGIVAGRVL